MKSHILTEAKDRPEIFESGVQRRIAEPDIELDKRVSINATDGRMTIKDDSLLVNKILSGRHNFVDSPVVGVLSTFSSSIDVSTYPIRKVGATGNTYTIAGSVPGLSGYILIENTNLSPVVVNFSSFYKKDFGGVQLITGDGLLVKYANIEGVICLNKIAHIKLTPFPNGSLGHLVVNSGQTHTLQAGGVYDYASITVHAGGTININASSSGALTQLYCVGDFVLNGTIYGKRFGNGGTFTRSTATGTSISYTILQASGGRGQDGNSGIGGAGTNGYGGGGGGGAHEYPGGNGGAGGGNGGNGTSSNVAGGAGGLGNYTGNVGEQNRGTTWILGHNGGHGGGSGGGGGGAGRDRSHSSNKQPALAGSGGGNKGLHGVGLYLFIKGAVSGSGKIDLKGTNGYAGGNNIYISGGVGWGGAGGGGAGGSGGTLVVRDVGDAFKNNASTTPTTGKIHVDVAGGLGGGGGARTYGPGGSAQNGQNGNNGVYNVQGM